MTTRPQDSPEGTVAEQATHVSDRECTCAGGSRDRRYLGPGGDNSPVSGSVPGHSLRWRRLRNRLSRWARKRRA